MGVVVLVPFGRPAHLISFNQFPQGFQRLFNLRAPGESIAQPEEMIELILQCKDPTGRNTDFLFQRGFK